ncbi:MULTISPECIES: hypothetical protein [unclassified Paenibacillus]|uniref:hypothetical protein n=1 Tax=unclassified Paenibacillus TaxID=185978 RepID=UPI002405B4E4|nr:MULTISPECIES: hypothetical protein [unclassified Paenibacillus]MDF9843752.1 hypothetical protein [Paenibacillus sp. PastF-2]MDF9850409.1 hypothetical protein [Paenibacillus sp. PastM-2]MDF9856888.1 hypothetical protein [Paenibacillus sp. PastF-1]MDH6482255.1 hypothetical protein [Paenibacillus sp. PastH-2]MDH6509581.1 hypothetical protein [Paenibacillus sp. PastM-3]
MKSPYIILGSLLFLFLSACTNSNTEASLSNETMTNLPATVKTVVYSEVQFIHLDKNQLVNEADAIVKGRVLSQEVQKNFEGFPVTDTTIQVQTVFKGEPGENVEVRVDGGKTEDMILVLDEDYIPKFEIDEEVIVFLSADKGDRPDKNDFGYYVVGQSQGNFSLKDTLQNESIENDAKTLKFDLNNFQEEINQAASIN